MLEKIIKILIILLIPLILALPTPLPLFNHQKIKMDLQGGEPLTKEKSSFFTTSKALGSSLLSRILGIETFPMPAYLCIKNTSETLAEDKKINSGDLLEDKDNGVIKITLILDNADTIITIPFASTTCVYPQMSVEMENEIKVRGFLPFGKPEITSIDGKTAITLKGYPNITTIFKMEGEKGYNWKWNVFLKNYLLFLTGWIILLSSALQDFTWVLGKNKGSQK